ncbi:MAG: phage minor tail protein L [Marivivens sp.]|nr:phage minor tail protein L [Marivivens sp.]NCW67013.1 phage minor tail protein L [Marivivens sp.]
MSTPQSIQEQLQSLEPSAIIELFELELTEAVNGINQTYYYHAGTNELSADIVFSQITYAAFPIEVEGFEVTSNGTLPRPTMRIANANNSISTLLVLYNPLKAKITRIRTCKKFLDAVNFSGGNATADPTAKFEDEIWYIDRVANENPQVVEFELTSKLDLTNLALPRRQVLEHCPWKYRGAECRYTGANYFDINDRVTDAANDQCGKRYTSCALRFTSGLLPFGGFPGARLQA